MTADEEVVDVATVAIHSSKAIEAISRFSLIACVQGISKLSLIACVPSPAQCMCSVAPMSDGAFSSPTTTFPPTRLRSSSTDSSTDSNFNCNDNLNFCNLVNHNLLMPMLDCRFEFEETLLIFDWDDTLLPSTWIQHQGLIDGNSELATWQQKYLGQVADTVAETLCIGKQHGTVVLVTNAQEGWIEWSCQKFMPTLSSTLLNTKIISARSTYESKEFASPSAWKLRAFENELERVYGPELAVEPNMRKNVLSFGDGLPERDALLNATEFLPNCRSKSLKFVERPYPSQLIKQHSFIRTCLDNLVHYDSNLDICIKCP